MSATKKTDIESLVSAAQSGSGEAINALVHAMRPTVEMIAMKYIHSPLEKDDLVQEGMIGLLAALRAYQPKRGAAFRTFAGTCIENAIQTALRKFSRRKDVPTDNMVSLEDYLDHAGTARYQFLVFQHFEKYLAGYVVGIISCQYKWLSVEYAMQVHFQKIVFYDAVFQRRISLTKISH